MSLTDALRVPVSLRNEALESKLVTIAKPGFHHTQLTHTCLLLLHSVLDRTRVRSGASVAGS